MQYEGNLYGKVGRSYIPLMYTTKDIEKLESDLAACKSNGGLNLNTLFEIQAFHGEDAMIHAVKQMLIEHKKTMQFPYQVSANNGDDIVYIHEDGHTTWNSKE